jgi:UPF0755 protein
VPAPNTPPRPRRRVHAWRRLTALLVLIALVVVVVAVVGGLGHHRAPSPSGPRVERTVNVTIIPGQSRMQVQEALARSRIRGDYMKATVSSPLLDPAHYGAPGNTPTLEGFMWPDTYNLRRPVKVGALVTDQLTTFKREFAQINFDYARSKNLTPYDVLKIASLVSGESRVPSDAAKVASVIYNRLRLGMDLGLDSTVEYATGHYGALTEKDLESSSPWNTRNHAGLPPTPINSPDLGAMQAAAHPARTDYLYFINKVCGGGALRFTNSYDQFLQWSSAWNTAVTLAEKHNTSAEFCRGRRP